MTFHWSESTSSQPLCAASLAERRARKRITRRISCCTALETSSVQSEALRPCSELIWIFVRKMAFQ